jgi:hypothetical protein
LSAVQRDALKSFARSGGKLVVVPPCGMEIAGVNVVTLDPNAGPNALPDLIAKKVIVPRIRRVSGDPHWRVRLRAQGNHLVLHLLNDALEGVEHPTVLDRMCQQKVLHTIRCRVADEPLVIELDTAGLATTIGETLVLSAIELHESRPVHVENLGGTRFRLNLDLRGTRFYAQVGVAGN